MPPIIRGSGLRGIGFPIEKGREGYWTRRNGRSLRQTSIMQILGTYPGERVGEPEFGSRLRDLIFEPNDEILLQRIREETVGALQRWDPYIEVVGVAPEVRDNQVKIFIDYIDTSDEARDRQTLVFALKKL